jgi:NAD(P)-dependent dehydrogenase (short-subunit alcohol dehydrogenase family)
VFFDHHNISSSEFYRQSLNMMKTVGIGAAALASVGVAAKLSIEKFWFKGNPIGPPPPKLTEDELKRNLGGKQYVIVGGTKGIGLATAKALAKRGAKVIVVGRFAPRENLSPLQVDWVSADLSTLPGMRQLSSRVDFSAVDAVMFTTGVFPASTRQLTNEGIELDLAVTYLNRFIITNDILGNGKLGAMHRRVGAPAAGGGDPRVFIMAFPGGENTDGNYKDMNWDKTPYNTAKVHFNIALLNDALVNGLVRRYGDRYNIFGLNPGLVKTGLRENLLGKGLTFKAVEGLIGLMFQSADNYAEQTLIQLIASPALSNKSEWQGAKFNQFGDRISGGEWVSKPENAEKVWRETEEFIRSKSGTH